MKNKLRIPRTRLVYIPEINSKTWLLLTTKGGSACLRDYQQTPPKEIRDYSKEEIEELLQRKGSSQEFVSHFTKHPVTNVQHWREEIMNRNIEMNLEPLPPNRLRMLNVFKKQYRETDNKKALFEKWTHYFTESILNKKQFNRYDNESAEDERESDTGKGWTSQLLENSRLNKRAQYIATNVKECDFCLAAHELSLGISSMKNHLQAKRSDQIKPDGLAVRKNGFFSVFEIKAFNDIQKIDEALLQAICGALAIYAKRSMIVAIARSDNGPFRPAIKNARIPKLKPSLGVHLLMAADDKGDPIKGWSKKIELLSAEILENFKQLEYIAFSFLNRKQAKDIRTITISYLITRDGIKRL